MTPLEEMKVFLCNIDEKKFHPVLSDDDRKLHILNPLNIYEDKILEKCHELGIKYCMSREPYFDRIDPNTLEQPLKGYRNPQYWFEMIE